MASRDASKSPARRPLLLAIETATLQAGVALVDAEGHEIASRHARVTTHSEQLLAMVAEVLDEAGLRPPRLDAPAARHGVDTALAAIACGAGPGSFTGLRIGLATAKGLSLASGVPLLLVSSLAALAHRAPPGVLAVPCIDAFKGEVYAGFYARGRGAAPQDASALTQVEPEAVLAPERLAERLRARLDLPGGSAVHLMGDGAARWPVLEMAGLITTDRVPPHALDVGRLAVLRLQRGEADDLAAAVPTYIRPSEAELKGPPPAPSRDPGPAR